MSFKTSYPSEISLEVVHDLDELGNGLPNLMQRNLIRIRQG